MFLVGEDGVQGKKVTDGSGHEGSGSAFVEPMQRMHGKLSTLGRMTCELLLREALESRLLGSRYNPETLLAQGHGFDMKAMCHLSLSNLRDVENIMDVDAVDEELPIEGCFLELAASIVNGVEVFQPATET